MLILQSNFLSPNWSQSGIISTNLRSEVILQIRARLAMSRTESSSEKKLQYRATIYCKPLDLITLQDSQQYKLIDLNTLQYRANI
jgi:hypothetical protein